jgi:predicted nucleotidyltransferase
MKTNIDINPDHLDNIKKILYQYLPKTTAVWVFGSRAKGNAKKFSDLDLVIEAEKDLPSDIITRLKFEFEESALPYKVDVLDWHAISEFFKEAIKKDRVLLD